MNIHKFIIIASFVGTSWIGAAWATSDATTPTTKLTESDLKKKARDAAKKYKTSGCLCADLVACETGICVAIGGYLGLGCAFSSCDRSKVLHQCFAVALKECDVVKTLKESGCEQQKKDYAKPQCE